MKNLHQFAIAVRVDMPVSIPVQIFPEIFSIDQVPIVRESDSVRAVDVEGLGFSACAATGSRIPQVSQTHEAGKILYSGSIMEDLSCHAIAFALVDSSARSTSSYATCILSAVLQVIQGIVEVGSRGGGREIVDVAKNEPEDSAHLEKKISEPAVNVMLLAGYQLEHEKVFPTAQTKWGSLFSPNNFSAHFG